VSGVLSADRLQKSVPVRFPIWTTAGYFDLYSLIRSFNPNVISVLINANYFRVVGYDYLYFGRNFLSFRKEMCCYQS